MNYLPAQQINTARSIVRSAQRQIKNRTGIKVHLLLAASDNILKTPKQMLKVIAIALNMNPDCYRIKSRARNIVEMRFIAALLLRSNFPRLTLTEIATLFGGQDHSSVINSVARAHSLIYTGDEKFINKYNTVLKSVDIWLKREESGYASATSA